LVKESTLTTANILLSNSSDFSPGNTTIASKDYCYEIEADKPQFDYSGPKVMIQKLELPITMSTTDTIGTICSQRLFQILLDSGSRVSMIKRSALPKGASLNCFVTPNLLRPLQVTLKLKMSPGCKN
jgi:hypothetical protein